MFSTVYLLLVHPAVPSFRRLNWRQETDLQKKISLIFLKNQKINNIKIKKNSDSNGIGSPLGCYCIHRFCLPPRPCVRSAVLFGPYHLLPQSTAGPHLDRRALLLRRALPLAWAACLPHRTCISFGIFFFFHTFQCLRFM